MLSTKAVKTTLMAIITTANDALTRLMFAKILSMVNMAYLPWHPCVTILQFYSQLASGRHNLCTLLSNLAGCESPRHLFLEVPHEVANIRNTVAHTSMMQYTRNIHKYQQYPWRIAPLSHEGIPLDFRRELIVDLADQCEGCVDRGLGRLLRSVACMHGVDDIENGLLSGKWQLRLKVVFRIAFQLHTMDRELDNAADKRRICSLNCWALICARSINAMAKKNFNDVREHILCEPKSAPSEAPIADDASSPGPAQLSVIAVQQPHKVAH
jgi:hypothetical protein